MSTLHYSMAKRTCDGSDGPGAVGLCSYGLCSACSVSLWTMDNCSFYSSPHLRGGVTFSFLIHVLSCMDLHWKNIIEGNLVNTGGKSPASFKSTSISAVLAGVACLLQRHQHLAENKWVLKVCLCAITSGTQSSG